MAGASVRAFFSCCAFAAVLLVLAACSQNQPIVEPVDQTPTAVGVGEPPRAVVSRSGIVLPVLSSNGSAFVVSTPCGRDAELEWGQALRDIAVVLDPGHGGASEPGAQNGDLTEASANLLVAQKAATLLEAKGISVALTRTGDYRVPITSRVAVIEALDPKAYVSVHHNASPVPPSDTPGSEVYAQTGSNESRRLGGLLYQRVFDTLSGFDEVSWISAEKPGVLSVLNENGEDVYGIVRSPAVPGVLAELAYLSNSSEAELVKTEEYQEAVAAALADSIADFVSKPSAQGTGFVDEPRESQVADSTGGVENCEDPAFE